MRDFLVNRDQTGREIVYYPGTGKKYYIEYLGNNRTNWGDVDPASGDIQGSYGLKYKGSVDHKDSLITEDNGFINIEEGKGSPYDEIEKRHNEYKLSIR